MIPTLAWLAVALSHTVTLGADVPPGLRCLIDSYPGALCGATATELVWCDGSRMPWRTHTGPRTHQQRLDDADLAEQMLQEYTPLRPATQPQVDVEPGRIRNEAFFAKLYGNSQAEVARHTAKVTWLDGTVVRVQTRFGIDRHLRDVLKDLQQLPADVTVPMQKTAGTFVWRQIHGTARRSAHSYATAIDVGVVVSDYWRWNPPDAQGKLMFRNRIPLQVAQVFERHGFIWGGRWYHYDTMHFEYRPELLHPACVGHGS